MRSEKTCPECGYPMDSELKRKGGRWRAKVEYMNCLLCGHRERVPGKTEELKLKNEKI